MKLLNIQKNAVLFTACFLGILVWFVDALFDYFIFYEGNFLDLLITDVPEHELYIRLLIMFCFVVFGLFASSLLAKTQENEALLKETQEIAKLGSWKWDITSDNLWWSEETYRIFGFTAGDKTAFSKFLDSIHPDDKKKVQDSINKAIDESKPLELDYRIILPDNSIRYLHEQSITITDSSSSLKKRRGSVQDVTEQKRAEQKRIELRLELNKAEEEIKSLKGILPICASCKEIRDDKGYWHQIESYIREHSEADFSHGICPKCAKKLYPEFDK